MDLTQWSILIEIFIITLVIALGIEVWRLQRDLSNKIDDIMEYLKIE